MARHTRRSTVFVIAMLICAAGQGAGPAGLIARLKQLDGGNMIRAAVHVDDRTSRTDDEDYKPLEKGDFVVTAEPNALTVAVVGEIRDSRVFREFSLLRAGDLVHYAPKLARELDGLKLTDDRPGSYQGAPCRHWYLKSVKKEAKSGVSSTTTRDVELWVGTDGYPLAGSFKTLAEGKLLRLFKFSAETARNQRYKRLGTRLVLVHDRNETDMSSKAGKEKRTITTTVDVKEN